MTNSENIYSCFIRTLEKTHINLKKQQNVKIYSNALQSKHIKQEIWKLRLEKKRIQLESPNCNNLGLSLCLCMAFVITTQLRFAAAMTACGSLTGQHLWLSVCATAFHIIILSWFNTWGPSLLLCITIVSVFKCCHMKLNSFSRMEKSDKSDNKTCCLV